MSQQHLLHDLQHRRGFLHRLDVPTSGLILVATSYRAYYDLQLQLMSGAMQRHYVVVSHGLSSATRIEANIHWLEDGPAWLSGSSGANGKAAITLLETVASTSSHHDALQDLKDLKDLQIRNGLGECRIQSKLRALSLIRIQILTGRCHQIRLHTAHVGHPVVTDGRYTSAATFQEDQKWCPRNFLHRYCLNFYDCSESMTSWTSQSKAWTLI